MRGASWRRRHELARGVRRARAHRRRPDDPRVPLALPGDRGGAPAGPRPGRRGAAGGRPAPGRPRAAGPRSAPGAR
ncbi:MAG: hypothetical protein F4X99_00625 [Gammaproteobacteria bacterium]|nr:hypothetical protein [Gammaproteobacteria bacterium]